MYCSAKRNLIGIFSNLEMSTTYSVIIWTYTWTV